MPAADRSTMAPRRRHSRESYFAPVPVAYLDAVLDSFWERYAARRHEGLDPDEAVKDSLETLLPPEEVAEVEQMLNGEFDEEFSIGAPFDGRMILHDLIATGDHYLREGVGTHGSRTEGPDSRWSERD
jgi:hypothetical protein